METERIRQLKQGIECIRRLLAINIQKLNELVPDDPENPFRKDCETCIMKYRQSLWEMERALVELEQSGEPASGGAEPGGKGELR